MTFKKISGKLHLWIGLPGAIIFFIICITGSIFVFSDEIINLSGKKYATVKEPENEWIPFEQMQDSLNKAYPGNMQTFLLAKKPNNSSFRFLVVYNHGLLDVFMNPYTGEILGDSRTVQFFFIIGHLHSILLWHGPGGWIVKIATVLFLITLITGLIIWLPKRKNKKSVKNAFSYKRHTTFKRHIFDLHRVWGFYGIGILLLLTITGLIMAFKPLTLAVSKVNGGDPSINYISEYPADTSRVQTDLRLVLQRYLQQPDIEEVQIGLFFLDKSSVLRINTGTKMRLLTYKGDAHLVDRYTGQEVTNKAVTQNMQVHNALMNLHTGKYLGWLGLLLTFLAGLLGAFLSLTGVILWWQKLR